METKVLTAEPRNDFGKNAANRLRAGGFVPAVVYSHGETHNVKVSEKALFALFKGKISESVIFDLKIDGQNSDDLMAFVKDYQTEPVTGKITHLDMYRVTRGEKIKTKVPIEFIGTAAGTKSGGMVEFYQHEIEVECFPGDLPEKVTVDISGLEIDANIHAREIALKDSVKLETNPEQILVAVHSPKLSSNEDDSEEAAQDESVQTDGGKK